MNIEKQREFIRMQLKRSASDAGVDIDQSLGGLLYIADYQENGEEADFGDDTEQYREDAARLLEAHGSSAEGQNMLRALGLACLIPYIPMYLKRDWEDWPREGDAIDAEWVEERSFVDYAMQVGFASSCCADYVARKSGAAKSSWFASIGAIGAEARHAPMRELRLWAIERYREHTYPSALAASHKLCDEVREHGKKIGAILSEYNAQRTIYRWLLDAAKQIPDGG